MTGRTVVLVICGQDEPAPPGEPRRCKAVLWHEQPIPEHGDMIVDLAPLVASIAAQAAAGTAPAPPPPLRQITVNRDTDGQILSVEAVEDDEDSA